MKCLGEFQELHSDWVGGELWWVGEGDDELKWSSVVWRDSKLDDVYATQGGWSKRKLIKWFFPGLS